MTTRVIALTVILEHPQRDDDVEALMSAIQLLRGVATVSIIEQNPDTEIAYHRAHFDIQRRLLTALGDSLVNH